MINSQSATSLLKYGLAPRIIACVAGIWSNSDKYCLPIQKAAAVIRASGSRILVLHIPSRILSTNEEALSFNELLVALEIPLDEMVLFFNTSLCSTLEDIQQVVEVMKDLSSIAPYNRTSSFLKLEILDKNQYPNDEETCEILAKLHPEICRTTIPFLTGNTESLRWITRMGCPAARIWCSAIGQRLGIIDKSRLQKIVTIARVPLILEGGIATANDVYHSLMLGFDAVLINSAFRYSRDPIQLASNIRATIDNM